MRSRKIASIAVVLSGIGVGLAGPGLGAPPPSGSSPPSLHILWSRELPPALQQAVDIRWASESSVYLALTKSGTVEASLDPLAGNLREMVPGAAKPGGFWGSSRIGASPEFLAVAGPALSLTWRKLAAPLRKEIAFDVIEDIDVGGRRLAVLGARRDGKGDVAPEGAIVWTGSLDKDLTDLKPLLYDQRGKGAPNLGACLNFELGAVRFLPDETLLVVPGCQAGAFLYESQGRLIRSWDTVALGLDNDCPGLSEVQARTLADPRARVAWLNQRRTLEDILPLPQGPGLLVRSVSQGRPSWELKVLDRNGSGHKAYAVPISPVSELSHLRGDFKNGRILLLMTTLDRTYMTNVGGRLVAAELPAASK